MKPTKHNFLLPFLILAYSCSFSPNEPDTISDAELVQLIIGANKVEISMSELPNQSISTVEIDYYDYDGIGAKRASGLGYEVELAGRGHRSGSRNEIYFNEQGRRLDPNNWGKGRYYDKDDIDRNIDGKEDWKCFDLVFPLTFEMPDGSTITVGNDDEDSWSDIKVWYELNPESEEKPCLQFPVVIFFEEEAITINSDSELRDAYVECKSDMQEGRDGRGKNCFELVYPVTFLMPDGSNITVTNDSEEGWNILKNWYEDNPGYEEVRPEFEYPVNILYQREEGDQTITINSNEEMASAKEECIEEWEEGYNRDCFEFVLPLTYQMPDGSVITVENEEGYMAIRNWYEENSDIQEEPEFQYPVDIIYEAEDGSNTTATINNGEEMEAAYQLCEDDEE